MIYLLVGVPACALLLWIGFSHKLDVPWDFLVACSGFLGIVALVIAFASAGCSKATIRGDLAAVEQLREAARNVDLQASEDVAGKVADFNVEQAQRKWMNKQWWGDPFVPDEWDTVSFIPLHRGRP